MTMTNLIRQITLNNGVEMPVLGFGVYQIPAEETEQAVSDALEAGYRALDTAAAGVACSRRVPRRGRRLKAPASRACVA